MKKYTTEVIAILAVLLLGGLLWAWHKSNERWLDRRATHHLQTI